MAPRRVETVEHNGWQLEVSNNESGYNGVTPSKAEGKWQARLTLRTGEKQTDLGSFDTPLEAAIAIAKARLALAADSDWRPKDKQQREGRGAKRMRCAPLCMQWCPCSFSPCAASVCMQGARAGQRAG
jgi:hypothetical protein